MKGFDAVQKFTLTFDLEFYRFLGVTTVGASSSSTRAVSLYRSLHTKIRIDADALQNSTRI